MKSFCLLLFTSVVFSSASYSQYIASDYSLAQPGPIPSGSINAPVIRIQIVVGAVPVTLDSLLFNSNGCTSYATDVSAAKLFFTDSDSTFSSGFLYSLSSLSSFPGESKFSYPLLLNQGVNYLWLAYDVSHSATTGNCLSARFDSLYFGAVSVNPVFDTLGIICIPIGNIPLATYDISGPLSKINLYPNPTNGILNLQVPSINSEFKLKIFDGMGHSLLQISEKSLLEKGYDLSSLAKGIYGVQITSGGTTYYSKLIKE